MIEKVDNYTCDECGCKSTNKYDFRTFIGNVAVGNNYGADFDNTLIGENIRSTPECGYRKPLRGNAESIMVYDNHYCLHCTMKKLGIAITIAGVATNILKEEEV